jgi:NAD(P)-dependent dehydrogenase (short-subunit alcohol dehydrogenase family)
VGARARIFRCATAAVASILSQTKNTLDAVVHNAGIAVAGALEDLPESEIRRVMETNFFGVLELTRTLLPIFRAQRRGRIVLVSSQAAFAGQPANSIYCASKWALEGWADASTSS